MSLAFIDPEINAFEFHDLDKDMSNIPDGGTEKLIMKSIKIV